jgi:hypothetical protein
MYTAASSAPLMDDIDLKIIKVIADKTAVVGIIVSLEENDLDEYKDRLPVLSDSGLIEFYIGGFVVLTDKGWQTLRNEF